MSDRNNQCITESWDERVLLDDVYGRRTPDTDMVES
jgi:hypothetical protein